MHGENLFSEGGKDIYTFTAPVLEGITRHSISHRERPWLEVTEAAISRDQLYNAMRSLSVVPRQK